MFSPVNKYQQDFYMFRFLISTYIVEMQQLLFAATSLQRNFIEALIASETQNQQNYD
jgi:hypothetical protein